MSDTPYIITQTIALFSCILSPGFIAARLYRAGYNDRKTDIGFYTAFFNLFTVMSYVFLPASWPLMLVLAVSMILPFIVLWALKRWDYRFFAFLRKLNITNSNNYGTVWQTIINHQHVWFDFIILHLKDGKVFMGHVASNELSGSKMFPWITDKEGNIAIHVTHSKKPSDQDWTLEEAPLKNHYMIRYFHASEIASVSFRYKNKTYKEKRSIKPPPNEYTNSSPDDTLVSDNMQFLEQIDVRCYGQWVKG